MTHQSVSFVKRSLSVQLLTLAALLLFSISQYAAAESNWPQFRGPGARGIADDPTVPDRWSATENVLWKTDLPGRGWSSPIVWGNRIFLTTVINRGKLEEPKKGLYFGGNRPKSKSVHEWWVYCINLQSGKTEWRDKIHEGKPESAIHLKSSYGAETAVTDGKLVYFHFGDQGVFAYTLAGKPVWSKKIRARKTRYGWGTASSPALHEQRLYLVNDNEEDSFVLALDKSNGETLWRVGRKEGSNWSTPYIWENSQRTELIVPGTGRTSSYDLNGKERWHFTGGMSSITIATPYAEGDQLFVTSGYVGSKLKPIYCIRPGAKGDISLDRGENSNEFITWCEWGAAPYNPGTLLYRDRLYVLLDRGMLSVLNPRTGRRFFDRERIPGVRAFTSSPWANDGKVFCLNEDGVTVVFRAGDEFELLHTNRLADDDMCLSTPAIANGRLLIRSAARLYCIGKTKE
jgi:outer membrane protein assembly factor BamB